MLMLDFHFQDNIMIVSVSKSVTSRISELLLKEGFLSCICANGIGAAKLILIETDVELVIIDAPLPDEDATQFALDLAGSKSFDYGIILLTKANLYEQNSYQAERMGIATFKKPVDPHLLVQTIRLLLSFRGKLKNLESKADKLQKKLEDDRLINKAKFLLVEHLKMSEQDSHHYIEKRAMDSCVKKTKIANDIIRIYEKK